jgi:hypothetical protein
MKTNTWYARATRAEKALELAQRDLRRLRARR